MAKLPLPIITNILTRLPVKPLLRFKSVSKSWCSLINSPNFIKLHLSQSLSSGSHTHLIISQISLSLADITPDNLEKNRSVKFTELDHPIKQFPNNPIVQILGSCNGILCISTLNKSSVFLFNPSTKTHRLIPPFSPNPLSNAVDDCFNPNSINIVEFGFGYDSLSDDYKLLRIIETRTPTRVFYREASVYSVKNDSWKCVDVPTTYYMIQPEAGALVNETLHFVVGEIVDEPLKQLILCFNLGDETFSRLELPNYDDVDPDGGYIFSMGDLGGSFCVMVNYLAPGPNSLPYIHVVCGRKLSQADLWVMKEYGKEESWVKLFSISEPNSIGSRQHIRPLMYSRDGERVLIELDHTHFAWYYIRRNKCARVKVRGGPARKEPITTWCSVGSLVSLKKDVVESKEDPMPKKTKKKKKKKNRSKKKTKDCSVSEDLKLKLSETDDAANRCNARDDNLSKEFELRLSNQIEDVDDFYNA